MRPFLLLALLSIPLAAQADDVPKKKGGFLGNMRYGIGVGLQIGGGMHDRLEVGAPMVLELAAMEFRSHFSRKVAWHTTLNFQRMLAQAAAEGTGRIDYDLHVGAHLPVGPRTEVVVAPGASLAYGFSGSTYQRFVGDVRVGLDLSDQEDRRWTVGVYVRPFVGWLATDPVDPSAPVRRGVTAGAVAEAVFIAHVATKADKARRRAEAEARDAELGI